MFKKIQLFFFFLLTSILPVNSAVDLPVGNFLQDSVKIGQPVRYMLCYKHVPNQEIILPDSTFSYAPFEFVSKTYYPTRTRGNISTDSVIYTLRTFDLGKVQRLQIPVLILQNGTTQPLKPAPDSIFLQELVTLLPSDSLMLKANTQLIPVNPHFNYPYAFVALGVILLLALGVWGIFGRRIIINFNLYKLKNDHNAFVSRYNTHIERFNRVQSLENIEKAITLWKNYLTRLEGSAINSFTTKEIAQFYGEDEDVTTALKLFDKAIYGNMLSDESSETIVAFYLLHHFADRRYEFIKNQTRYVAVAR
ncbi:hypothetical protein HUW51_18170 [Adhaeribacter swui]|uniref:Protein BatD n=1 Tax=Adhaeribacter swui TaxID=2086471 RepID=A0A7G7GBM5_9BACT|nr:hypothetical protein [Adhaeribacter swui]QNF34559.1 hypothetical protein HUW51_18170 [Adhaeribacter swui]